MDILLFLSALFQVIYCRKGLEMNSLRLLGFSELKHTLLSKTLQDRESKQLDDILASLRSVAEDQIVREWVMWCRSRPGVQVVETAVPPAIVAGAALVDVKVGTGSGRRRQRDDVIYNENEDIRRQVARGNCVLRLPGDRHLCLTHALKKQTLWSAVPRSTVPVCPPLSCPLNQR